MNKSEILETLVKLVLEAGKVEMSSGHLYARLMEHGMDLNSYTRLIETLTNIGAIKIENDLIITL